MNITVTITLTDDQLQQLGAAIRSATHSATNTADATNANGDPKCPQHRKARRSNNGSLFCPTHLPDGSWCKWTHQNGGS